MPRGSHCSSTSKTAESGSRIERLEGKEEAKGATKQHHLHLSPLVPTDKQTAGSLCNLDL